jgi:signal transduction histidine kinase
MLHELIKDNREEIIRRTRARIAERVSLGGTEGDLDYIPRFLNQLIETLRCLLTSNDELCASAAEHGSELRRLGFSVAQVVHGYGDVCQVVTELASELHAPISTHEFRLFNHCLDEALAQAVGEYGRQLELSVCKEGTERLGFLAHELRNLLSTAMLAFDAIKRGSVGLGGSTSELLGRSLIGLRNLIDRALVEVRLGASIQKREPVWVAELIEEIEIAAAVEAKFRALKLIVPKVDGRLKIEVDRALLTSAVANLLQNAFKFSRPHGQVVLRVQATPQRVFIAVEDACGGLSTMNPEELFRPFAQRDQNRSGLGLGLSICRQAVVANGGDVHVLNLPGQGCVFTIELPRATSSPEIPLPAPPPPLAPSQISLGHFHK